MGRAVYIHGSDDGRVEAPSSDGHAHSTAGSYRYSGEYERVIFHKDRSGSISRQLLIG